MSKILVSCALLSFCGSLSIDSYAKNGFYGGGGLGLNATKGIGKIDRSHNISYGKTSSIDHSTLPIGFKNHGINLHAVFGYHWANNKTYKSIDLLYQGGGNTQSHTFHSTGSPVLNVGIRQSRNFALIGRYGFKVDKDLYIYGSLGFWHSRFDVALSSQNTPTGSKTKKYFGIAPGLGVIKKGDTVSVRLDYFYLYYTQALRLDGSSRFGSYTLTINPSSHIFLLSIIFDL